MTYASSLGAALFLAVAAGSVDAAPIKPILPCDKPMHVFGGPTVLAKGVKEAGRNDFVTRMTTFVRRVCGTAGEVEDLGVEQGGVVGQADTIAAVVGKPPGVIGLIHYPFSDIEDGAPVDVVLQTYRKILEACSAGGSLCIIGGQQPVNSLGPGTTERQLELERRATETFGMHYMPIYRHFQSQSARQRLMIRVDSGDGRMIGDPGHDLLFELYRRRLLELTAARGRS
jgi:hypothetical protein